MMEPIKITVEDYKKLNKKNGNKNPIGFYHICFDSGLNHIVAKDSLGNQVMISYDNGYPTHRLYCVVCIGEDGLRLIQSEEFMEKVSQLEPPEWRTWFLFNAEILRK